MSDPETLLYLMHIGGSFVNGVDESFDEVVDLAPVLINVAHFESIVEVDVCWNIITGFVKEMSPKLLCFGYCSTKRPILEVTSLAQCNHLHHSAI